MVCMSSVGGGGILSGCARCLPPASLKGNPAFSFWPQDCSDSLRGRRRSISACVQEISVSPLEWSKSLIPVGSEGWITRHGNLTPPRLPRLVCSRGQTHRIKVRVNSASDERSCKALNTFAGYLEPFQRGAKVIKDKILWIVSTRTI